jgi:hypothetical protein
MWNILWGATNLKNTIKMGYLAVALAMLITAGPALAHHSFAAEYDAKKPITLSGTMTKLEWTNPHARLYLSVKGENGDAVVWEFELGSPNALARHGWTRNSLKPGDGLTVMGYLAKDGAQLANVRSVTMADGRKVFARSSNDGSPTQ